MTYVEECFKRRLLLQFVKELLCLLIVLSILLVAQKSFPLQYYIITIILYTLVETIVSHNIMSMYVHVSIGIMEYVGIIYNVCGTVYGRVCGNSKCVGERVTIKTLAPPKYNVYAADVSETDSLSLSLSLSLKNKQRK